MFRYGRGFWEVLSIMDSVLILVGILAACPLVNLIGTLFGWRN